MSQVAAKRKMKLQNEKVKVTAHFYEEGSVLAGTAHGECTGFQIELYADGDYPPEELIKLARMAHQMCFTEHTLLNKIEIKTNHIFNGHAVDLD